MASQGVITPGFPLISGVCSGISSGRGITFFGPDFSTTGGVTTAGVLLAGFLLDARGAVLLGESERSATFGLAEELPAFLVGTEPVAPNVLGAVAAGALAAVFSSLDLGIIGDLDTPRSVNLRKRGAGHNRLRVALQG
jgi:hypothetical protein